MQGLEFARQTPTLPGLPARSGALTKKRFPFSKLARVLWAMIKHRRPYQPARLGNPDLRRARKERFLRRQAEELGFALTPIEGQVS